MDDVDIIRFPQILTREQHAERISELQEEFENPHISEDPKKRLQNAIVYVQERKWSLNKAAEKAGVSTPAVFRYACGVTLFFFVFLPLSLFLDYILSFCRAMKALKEGRIPGESRHRQLLTNEELQEVREEIDRRTMRLDAPKSNAEIKEMLMAKFAERRCNNTYAREAIDFSFSDVTFYKYKQIMGLTTHVGDVKTTARVNAYLNLRNAVSLCASTSTIRAL